MHTLPCLLAGSAGADSKVTKIFKRSGVGKVELDSASAGDVVSLAGAASAGIADTIGDAELAVPLSPGPIEPPTLRCDSYALLHDTMLCSDCAVVHVSTQHLPSTTWQTCSSMVVSKLAAPCVLPLLDALRFDKQM